MELRKGRARILFPGSLVCLLTLALFNPTAFANGFWIELATSASGGGISDNPGWSQWTNTVIDSKNQPVVVWSDLTSGSSQIYMKRWNGMAWEALPGAQPGDTSATGKGLSAGSFGTPYYPVVALDHLDNPVVAWPSNSAGTYWVNVAKWNGVVWVFMPTFQVSIGLWPPTERPLALAMGKADDPWLAFVQNDNKWGTEINVVHWKNGQWQKVPGSNVGIEEGGGGR